MEWNNQLVLEFLHHYENEPVIWNPSFPNHKDRYAILEAWKRIENKMDNKFTVGELKRKKDSLMAAYRSLTKKIKESTLKGVDAYRPNWFAYELMERFLKYKTQQHTETLSIEAQHENDEQYEQILELDLTDTLPSGEEDSELEAEALFLRTPAVPSFKQLTQKRFKASDETEIKRKTDSASATPQSHVETQCERNICDIYGELVAARLKAMDESTRDICMNRIDNILFEMKMSKGLATPSKSLTQNQHSPPSTS